MIPTRVLTAAALLVPAALALWIGGWVLILVGLVVFAMINYEFFSFATSLPQTRRLQFTGFLLLIPCGFLAFDWGWEGWAAGTVIATMSIAALCVMIVEAEDHMPISLNLLPASALGIFYTGILGSFLVVVPVTLEKGIVAWLVLSVAIADTCAYYGGSLLKGPKLAPRISPNKTISGSVCGVLGAMIFSAWMGARLGVCSSTILLILDGFLIGVTAVLGDLIESLIKRAFNVKDTGTLLPGHGGLLDRVDALIFAAPIALLIP